jgi:hypothetical protein
MLQEGYSANKKIVLDLESYPKSTYILIVKADRKLYSKKIIVN